MIKQGEFRNNKPLRVLRPAVVSNPYKNNEAKRYIICKYLRDLDSPHKLSIFIYDKLEQTIVYREECNRYDHKDIMSQIYELFNALSLEEVVVSDWPESDHVIIKDSLTLQSSRSFEAEVVRKYTDKNPNIALHIKRLAQVHEFLSKYKININEIEAKFFKEHSTTVVFLWDHDKNILKGDMKIIYNYPTGDFSFYHKGVLLARDFSLDEIFKSHII